jgi:hypothetical protein
MEAFLFTKCGVTLRRLFVFSVALALAYPPDGLQLWELQLAALFAV